MTRWSSGKVSSPSLVVSQWVTSDHRHNRYRLRGSVTGAGNPPGPRAPVTTSLMLSRARPSLSAISVIETRPASANPSYVHAVDLLDVPHRGDDRFAEALRFAVEVDVLDSIRPSGLEEGIDERFALQV